MFLIGLVGSLGTLLAAHLVFFGFDGWRWGAMVWFSLIGIAASLAGSAVGGALADRAASDDYLSWSRKVQRGSLALKRCGHRKTL